MAAAAFFGADRLIITTDNPRYEAPLEIIRDITQELSDLEKQFPGEKEPGFYTVIRDRREAIRRGIGMLEKGDLLLIAGKGHEEYQEICGKKYPFNEREIIAGELKIPFKRL